MPKFLIYIIAYKHVEEKGRTRNYVPLSIPVSHTIEKGPQHIFKIHHPLYFHIFGLP